MVERIEPILSVANLERSLRFYTEVLGFQVSFQMNGFAGIGRESGSLYLCEGGQGQPGTWVWIGVDDVESLFRNLLSKNVKIRHAPQNYPWALEMKVEDPDGHVLRFGSEPIPDRPFDAFSG